MAQLNEVIRTMKLAQQSYTAPRAIGGAGSPTGIPGNRIRSASINAQTVMPLVGKGVQVAMKDGGYVGLDESWGFLTPWCAVDMWP